MGFFSKILGVFNQDKYNKSDKERWKPIGSLKKSWGSRTIEMSKFITPNSTIIEFGAGRMVLKNHLPEACSYTPSDIVDRGPGTIVIDLNNSDLPKFDNMIIACLVAFLNI